MQLISTIDLNKSWYIYLDHKSIIIQEYDK